MEARPTEPFRREHAELHSHIEHIAQAAREISRLDEAERKALVGRIVHFLRGTLVPHAKAEEQVLYPEWAKLVGFDDAPFQPEHRGDVLLVGAVYAGERLVGVLSGKVRRDGANATRVLAELVTGSRYAPQLHALLLQGIAVVAG